MNNLKKKLFILSVFGFLLSVSSAYSNNSCTQVPNGECPTLEEQKQIQDNAQNPLPKENCEKCSVEDDEYCIYNQCYFDKQYRMLKTKLEPDSNQENCLDNIYMNFKQDLEILCARYTKEKDKLLDFIVNNCVLEKEQKTVVKDIKSDIKEKYKDYLSETSEILTKSQKKIFKKFKREQNIKIKKIKKYGAVYKFPCS